MNDTVLEIQDLIKDFDNKRVVDKFSFKLKKGKIIGLLGPNGAGKTTSIRMIMDIISPDSGSIKIFGEKFSENLKNKIGYLPEERGLYRKLKVFDTITYFGELKGLNKEYIRVKGMELLKKFNLENYKDKKVEELSKGMSQKLQIIITILHSPELLILDEPFSGLDPINIELVKDLILKKKSEGISIIFSTHLMDYAEKIVDEVVMINNGKKVIHGELTDIKKKWSSKIVTLNYKGDIRFVNNLPFVKQVRNYGNRAEIEVNDLVHKDELLKALIDKISINSFSVSESSLNHIFITEVNKNRSEV